MKNKLSHFLNTLRDNKKLKLSFEISMLIVLSLFVFSATSLIYIANWLNYVLIGLFVALTIIYSFVLNKFKPQVASLYYLIFAIWVFIPTAIFSHAFRSWLTILLMAIIFAAVFYLTSIIENKRLVLFSVLIGLLGFAVFFIIVYRESLLDFSSRLGTYFNNQNEIGLFFFAGFIVSTYLALFYKFKFELAYLSSSLLFAYLCLLTGSKTSLLAIFISLILLIIFRFKNNKIVLFSSFGGIIALTVVLLFLPFMETTRHKIAMIFETIFMGKIGDDYSPLFRLTYIKYSFYLGTKHLLIGYGENGFSIYSGVHTYAHSQYGEILVSSGIIGLMLYYFPILYLLVRSFLSKQKPYFAIVFIVVLLIMTISSISYSNKVLVIMMAYAGAAVLKQENHDVTKTNI